MQNLPRDLKSWPGWDFYQAETYGFNEDRTDTKVTDSNDVETDETNDGATDGYDDREWIQWPIDSDDSTGSEDGFRLRQDFHFNSKKKKEILICMFKPSLDTCANF